MAKHSAFSLHMPPAYTIRRLMALLCVFMFILLLVHSSSIPDYAWSGLKLWAYSVLPALLPFIILSKFWIYYQVPELLLTFSYKVFRKNKVLSVTLPLFLLGLCSGFPVGAIFVRHFYETRILPKKTAENLLPLCSFVSPMFLLGYVYSLIQDTGLPCIKKEWHIMLFCLYAPLLLFYLARLHRGVLSVSINTASRHSLIPFNQQADHNTLSIGDILSSSLEIIFTIGVYMMLFSILFGLSMNYPVFHALPFRILMSNLEVTTGCQYIVAAAVPGNVFKNILLLVVLEFGGLCTFAQIGSVLNGSDLSLKCYFKTKLMTVFLSVLMYFALHHILSGTTIPC